MNIKLIVSRRMLQSTISDMVNNGLSYTAVVMPDGTIKLYLDMDVSLNGAQFQV